MNYIASLTISVALLNCAGYCMALQTDAPEQMEPAVWARCLVVLRDGLQSQEFWPAMHAAEALTLAGMQAEVVTNLLPRLSSESDDQRRCGLARELARAGQRAHLVILQQVLDDEQSNGRVHAAESLYKLNEAGDLPSLRQAMEQTANQPLRMMAAAAMLNARHDVARQLLRENLTSDNPTIRLTVAFVLARSGSDQDIKPLIEAHAREVDPVTKGMLGNAVACRGDPQGRRWLRENLDSDHPTIRTMAADCVGLCSANECHAKLIDLLDDPYLDARVRAAQSLIALSLANQKR